MFAYGVEISGLRGERLDYTLLGLESSCINYSGTLGNVWHLFFSIWDLKNSKYSEWHFKRTEWSKNWGTISNTEKKMTTRSKTIPLISYGDMRLIIVW